ncbi:MAG: hypothetical protein M3O36_08015 [Myxococcota bacterium]|nr:hypothetical protein [Myxococcota bacterium]
MPAAERKRPWYLVLALMGALALGMTGACSGWSTMTLYREPIDSSLAAQGIADEADRAAVSSRVDAYVRTLDGAKARGWPLGVASLLVGGAIVILAMRALGGSGGARTALVQLVVAQAGLNAASFWLMRDVFDADLRVFEARQAAEIHERVPEKPRADEMSRTTAAMLRAANPIAVVLRTIGSALVVVALTRRRSRAFFDPSAAALEER